MPRVKKYEELPHNSDAERAVLGSALLSRDSLYTVLSEISEDDLFEGRHKLIYRAMLNLQKKGMEVDVLTVTEELMNAKELENVGGVEYLKECSDSMVVLTSLEFYIKIVREQSTLRAMLIAIREIDNDYRSSTITDIDNFIQVSEEKIKAATEKRRVSSFKSLDEVAQAVALKMNTATKVDEDNVTGLTTGFDNINRLTNGFQKQEVTIVAARPSVGKTSLALNFAYRAATRKGVPVAIFSCEMSSESLVKRLVGAASNVQLQKINTNVLNRDEKAKVAAAIKEVAAAPIYIDDTPNIKIMDLIAKSRQLKAKHDDLGLILIDYLGLVSSGTAANKSGDARHEEVRKISAAIKGLARDLDVPIVVLAQLSRDVEKRDNKKPMMADLRDSGSIEQDADVIMLLYRENVKEQKENDKRARLSQAQRFEMVKKMKENQSNQEIQGDAVYVDINVAKNRNGQTGEVGLFFFRSYCRFEAPSKEWEEDMRNISAQELD